jgi:hypothetical protein
MNQKIKLGVLVGLLCTGVALGFQSVEDYRSDISTTQPGQMTILAQKLLNTASLNMIGAKGAAQVSQITDEASIQMQAILVKQNDEVIRLLKKIAGEK